MAGSAFHTARSYAVRAPAPFGSALISVVVILFALLLVATPPLAVLSLPHDVTAPAPVSRTSSPISQFA